MDLQHFSTFLSGYVCVVCASLGAGVAHAHGEAEDEEGGGPAGSGAGLRSHRGGLRRHATQGNSCLTLHMWDFSVNTVKVRRGTVQDFRFLVIIK